MLRSASCVLMVLALACSGGSSSPGGSGGGAFAGSGGQGGESGGGGTGGTSGSGGSGGSGGTECAANSAACEDCVHHGCQMGDLLGQCLTNVPDLCPGAWHDFKVCACQAGHDDARWTQCLTPWDSAAGIEGVVLEDCLRHEC